MAEHRVDGLTVTLRGYSGLPLPEDLTEAVELRVAVGTQLDLEQLADEVREDLAGRVFVIEQRYRETRWGASGDVMQLVVDVSNVVGGVAGLKVLWDAISPRVFRRGRPIPLPMTGETSAASARAVVAENLNIGADSIRVVGVEPVGDGYRVNLETPLGPFVVEIDSHRVSHMRRN